ncbi:hypothetical protein [Pseudomonas palleroniana]|uniref:Uncharacterized protein n=1 Tax=Pseudomonas palleroniana TaxID=191390 RepID=A0A125PJW4_9PSED|nr:hypothetical protein [Pseudomonas palleroniana]KWU52901.1 hypothetical protein AWV77_01115 [Pseudomonas palleroniana]
MIVTTHNSPTGVSASFELGAETPISAPSTTKPVQGAAAPGPSSTRQTANSNDLANFRDALVNAYVRVTSHLQQQERWRTSPTGHPARFNREEAFTQYLGSQQIKLDPYSNFHLNHEAKAGQTVNLLQFMAGKGWDQPVNESELLNMIKELSRPVEHSPPHGDLGGGLSWPTALDQEQRQAIYDAVTFNALELPEFHKLKLSQNAFGFLTQTVDWTAAELEKPRETLLKLLQSPSAQALGIALRDKFKGAGTAEEWTLSALQIGLDWDALLYPDKKNRVGGYDLSRRENWGMPLSFVVEGLTRHLSRSFGRNAAIAAYVLLSHHAPEMLVKGVPDNVTYGSPAWVSLKAIVAKADMRAPGLAATKTYEQLIKEDLSPISADEKTVEALAGWEGVIHWAVADGAIAKRDDNNYSPAEVERAGAMASERLETLAQASEAFRAPVPTRRSVALKLMKERLPEKYADVDLEKKVLEPSEKWRDYKGPYSLLDIALTNTPVSWDSTDPAIPSDVARYIRFLPDEINAAFEEQIRAYYDALKAASEVTVKHQISLLPQADKDALEWGELKFFTEQTVTRPLHSPGPYELPSYLFNKDFEKFDKPKDGPLFVESTYNGKKRVYEVDPTNGVLRHRKDLAEGLKGGLQGQWQRVAGEGSIPWVKTNTQLTEVSGYDAQRTARAQSDSPVQTFTSPRSQFIAETATRYYFKSAQRDELFAAARGATTFDTEVTEFEKIQAVTRALIPVAAAVHSFKEGRVGEGLAFLAVDIFGFALGGAGAATKVLKSGGSVLSKTGTFTRALVSAANPFAGGKALVSKGLPLHTSALGRGLLSWKAVSANRSVDRVFQHKPKGVVEGTHAGAETTTVQALLDETTGNWYRYDVKNQRMYGQPLTAFRPDRLEPAVGTSIAA